MVRILITAISVLLFASSSVADPESDRKAFVDYFNKRFPDVATESYVNGIYAIDKEAYEQWLDIEEFPPYEIAIEEGEQLFNTAFADGKGYADCFKNGGVGIRQNYPYFDSARKQVVTLELAINECREKHGEKPLGYKKGAIASISAYMASTSRGNTFDITIPDKSALAAYEDGKQYFYSKRGQLNFSCADCHVSNASMQIRADKLSAALGHPTHFPVYRSKWGEMGTLHRRFDGCNKQVRANPLPAQGEAYRNLEYFLTYMSNGLEVNGPGARK
jgi:sulfur-oxidizing protein SoxA